MRLIVTLDRDETGMIVARCPAIQGCISQGHTEEEALQNIEEAIRGCLEARAAHGMPLTVAVREVEVEPRDVAEEVREFVKGKRWFGTLWPQPRRGATR